MTETGQGSDTGERQGRDPFSIVMMTVTIGFFVLVLVAFFIVDRHASTPATLSGELQGETLETGPAAKYANQNLLVRSSPTTSADIVHRFPYGERVTVFEANTLWSRLGAKDREWWVETAFLQDSPPPVIREPGAYYTRAETPVYDSPSLTSGSEIMKLPADQKVEIYDQTENWYKVGDLKEAWVQKSAIDPPAASPVEVTPPAQASRWEGGASGSSAMDDSRTVSYRLEATSSLQGWLDSTTPTLIARCQENKTELYIVLGTSLQPELGLYNEHTVRVRLDGGKAERQRWSESTDGKAMFAPGAIGLLRRIAKADTLRVEVVPFNSNPGVIEFPVSGFGPHLKELAAACRWKA